MSLSGRTKNVLNQALADHQAAAEVISAVNSGAPGQSLAPTDSPTFVGLTLTGAATVATTLGVTGIASFSNDVKIASGHVVKVNNIQVLGAQGALIADVTPAADGTAVGTAFNTLLARLRAHGIIAT